MVSTTAFAGRRVVSALAERLPLQTGGDLLLPLQTGNDLLSLAIVFLVLAIIAAVLGARGVAGVSMTIAKWLVVIFIVLLIVSFLL